MTQPAKKYYTPEEYLSLENVAQTKNEYYHILVDQERIQVEYFRRLGPGHWELLVISNPAILNLQSVNVTIPLELIYNKTELEPSTRTL